MDKKVYWLIESNADLSITCSGIESCILLMEEDFESFGVDEQKETQYTLTPKWYTDEEYENLPEAEY